MAGQEDVTNEVTSDVRASFAWAQLLVGSILSGLAVWKLWLKGIDAQPSELLFGISIAYDEVRNFLLLPLRMLKLEAPPFVGDLIAINLVFLGAQARQAAQSKRVMLLLLWTIFIPTTLALLLNVPQVFGGEIESRLVQWLTYSAAMSIFFTLFPPPILQLREQAFVYLNLAATVCWGTVLLLLNWATS